MDRRLHHAGQVTRSQRASAAESCAASGSHFPLTSTHPASFVLRAKMRLPLRIGVTRGAFAPTAEALEKLRLFKMENGIAWLMPETLVLVRVRGTAASFVEVVTGKQKGRVGYVEAALVDGGWH